MTSQTTELAFEVAIVDSLIAISTAIAHFSAHHTSASHELRTAHHHNSCKNSSSPLAIFKLEHFLNQLVNLADVQFLPKDGLNYLLFRV